MYKGAVDLAAFSNCLSRTRHQIIYNGDITNVDFLSNLQKEFTNINHWMIGRGLLANPFLAEICKGVPKGQLNSGSCREILLQFHNELFAHYETLLFGPAHLLGKMKAIWSYLGQIFVDSPKITKKINKCTRVDQYKDNVLSFFETKRLAI